MPSLADRCQETTTTGGTGTLTLGGAVTGYRTFAASFTVGQSLYYTIDDGTGNWEIGIGTLVTSGTLSRDTVIESSNSNALVNFGSGTKRVFCSAPTLVLLPNQTGNSGKVLSTDGSSPSWTTTLNGFTIGNVTAGSGAFTTLSASSTVSGTGFSTYLASPPAIGVTTPAAGTFTALTANGNTTLGDASSDTVTFNAATVTLNNSTSITATSGNSLTLNGGAGSNGLVLNSSNNVGIGTSSPGAKLQVNTSAGAVSAIFTDATYSTLKISHADTTGNIALLNGANQNYAVFGSKTQLYYSGVVGATLDSSGNLGLGVTPSSWNDGITSARAFQIGSVSPYYAYSDGAGTTYTGSNAYYSLAGSASWKYVNSAAATQYQYGLGGQHIWLTAPSGTAGNPITFTQAMTLTAGGALLVGATSSGPYSGIRLSLSSDSGTTKWDVGPYSTSTNFIISAVGGSGVYLAGTSATSWTSASDERLKTDLKPIENAAQKISTLRAVTGRYITDEKGFSRSFLIAQDLQKVLPEAVDASDPDKLGVQYTDTIPLLVAAIKELSAELNELKAKVN